MVFAAPGVISQGKRYQSASKVTIPPRAGRMANLTVVPVLGSGRGAFVKTIVGATGQSCDGRCFPRQREQTGGEITIPPEAKRDRKAESSAHEDAPATEAPDKSGTLCRMGCRSGARYESGKPRRYARPAQASSRMENCQQSHKHDNGTVLDYS